MASRPADTDRTALETLVHGIFAITMTLLILDLRLPRAGSGSLRHDLVDLVPQAMAYAYGFLYLAAAWLSVRAIMGLHRLFDHVATLLLLVAVALTSLTPFTVSTVAASVRSDADLGTAVRLMAVVVAAAYFTSAVMTARSRRRGLLANERAWLRRPWYVVALIAIGPAAVGFALSYLSPWLGVAALSADVVLAIVTPYAAEPG